VRETEMNPNKGTRAAPRTPSWVAVGTDASHGFVDSTVFAAS